MDQDSGDEVTALEAVIGTLEAEYQERNTGTTSEAENLERTNASEHAPGSSNHDTIATSQELKLKNICSEEDLNGASLSGTDDSQTRQSRWRHLLAGGSGCTSKPDVKGKSPMDNGSTDTSSYGDAAGGRYFSKERSNIPTSNTNEVENMENQIALSKAITPSYPRTKIFSRNRETHYYMKSTLADKGTICRGPKDPNFSSPQIVDTSAPSNSETERPPPDIIPHSGTPIPLIRPTPDQVNNREIVRPSPHTISHSGTPIDPILPISEQVTNIEIANQYPHIIPHRGTPLNTNIPPISNQLANINRNTHRPRTRALPDNALRNIGPIMQCLNPVNLREWLDLGKNKGHKLKNMYIFKQILTVVATLHSKGLVLLHLRPSDFKLLKSYEVMYINFEKVSNYDPDYQLTFRNEKRPMEHSDSSSPKRKKPEENTTLVISNIPKPVSVAQGDSRCKHMSDSSEISLGSSNDTSEEEKWYASPEELSQSYCILSSNIYSLGVLLFELLSSFDSKSDRNVAMLSLRDRILPPKFLSENPEEAELCLSLLHPEPTSRPTTREILESDVVNKIEDLSTLSCIYDDEDVEMDVLQHFLESIERKKRKHSLKLMKEINLLEADIKEVVKRRKKMLGLPEKSLQARGKDVHQSSSGVNHDKSTLSLIKENIMIDIDEIESVYFSMRSSGENSNNGPFESDVHELLEGQETSYHTEKDGERNKETDGLGVFYDALSKYARYTKFKVCNTFRSEKGFKRNSIIADLSFDANEEYFASAGKSKKIKIYDFHTLLNGTADIQYPLVELLNESKLCCTAWNKYINNYLASSDYQGVVKLWDVGVSQEVLELAEHRARARSVDFSIADPTKLASAGEDGRLKLWKINEKNSITTFRYKSILCSVQFSKTGHLLACGSSDSSTYCFDLRNASEPLCVLAGHTKLVSNIRFLDSHTLVSASTDDTMKIWDLNSNVADKRCILTLGGHTNFKKFVGLSVSDDGYIVCGSETNEVFAYHRSFPMPITSHNFGSLDVVTGEETYDHDNTDGHYVTSVCWRNQSEMVIAANSTGTIKLLQTV